MYILLGIDKVCMYKGKCAAEEFLVLKKAYYTLELT